MRKEEIDFVQDVAGRRPIDFHYFKDRYALMILSYVIGKCMTVREIKTSPYAGLLRKPLLQELLSRLPDGVIRPDDLATVWPERSEVYRLTFGRWGAGDIEDDDREWYQMSRPGLNLVLHLAFSGYHNGPYYRLIRRLGEHPYQWDDHPVTERGLPTMSWARLDIDLERSEAVIEEVQSDWISHATADYACFKETVGGQWRRRLESEYGKGVIAMQEFRDYHVRVLAPHVRIWSEAMLMATIWLLYVVLAIERIYFHTFEGGIARKRMAYSAPSRSLYEELPRRFGMRRTLRQPEMHLDCPDADVRCGARYDPLEWFLLELPERAHKQGVIDAWRRYCFVKGC